MSVQTQQRRSSGGYLERPQSSSLADVIDSILDKGLVIDAFIRVSVVGIELITIDARIVIASVDTYLRFAEATNRLDLRETGGKDLGELGEDLSSKGASGKTQGAVEGIKKAVTGGKSRNNDDETDDTDDDTDRDDDESDEEQQASHSGHRSRSRR
jgi:hypothetical protein